LCHRSNDGERLCFTLKENSITSLKNRILQSSISSCTPLKINSFLDFPITQHISSTAAKKNYYDWIWFFNKI
jgi:hypothetical protein